MVCPPVWSIIYSLNLVDYLSVQADNHADIRYGEGFLSDKVCLMFDILEILKYYIDEKVKGG